LQALGVFGRALLRKSGCGCSVGSAKSPVVNESVVEVVVVLAAVATVAAVA